MMYPEEPMKRSLNVVRYSDSVKVQKRSSHDIFMSDSLSEIWREAHQSSPRYRVTKTSR